MFIGHLTDENAFRIMQDTSCAQTDSPLIKKVCVSSLISDSGRKLRNWIDYTPFKQLNYGNLKKICSLNITVDWKGLKSRYLSAGHCH